MEICYARGQGLLRLEFITVNKNILMQYFHGMKVLAVTLRWTSIFVARVGVFVRSSCTHKHTKTINTNSDNRSATQRCQWLPVITYHKVTACIFMPWKYRMRIFVVINSCLRNRWQEIAISVNWFEHLFHCITFKIALIKRSHPIISVIIVYSGMELKLKTINK